MPSFEMRDEENEFRSILFDESADTKGKQGEEEEEGKKSLLLLGVYGIEKKETWLPFLPDRETIIAYLLLPPPSCFSFR